MNCLLLQVYYFGKRQHGIIKHITISHFGYFTWRLVLHIMRNVHHVLHVHGQKTLQQSLHGNSEILEKALKRGKQPNGLVVVLFDKSLPRLLTIKDCSRNCKWIGPFRKKRVFCGWSNLGKAGLLSMNSSWKSGAIDFCCTKIKPQYSIYCKWL